MHLQYATIVCMRTTLILPDQLIENALKETGIKSKTQLIKEAVEYYMKSRKREKLIKLRGKIKIDLDLDKVRAKDVFSK